MKPPNLASGMSRAKSHKGSYVNYLENRTRFCSNFQASIDRDFRKRAFKLPINQAISFFNAASFQEKLKDAKLLAWTWKNVQDIEFLKALVLDFCADPQHAQIVESAWLPIPPEIKKAMAEKL